MAGLKKKKIARRVYKFKRRLTRKHEFISYLKFLPIVGLVVALIIYGNNCGSNARLTYGSLSGSSPANSAAALTGAGNVVAGGPAAPACTSGATDQDDAPDIAGLDSNCDGFDGDLRRAIFVDPVRGHDDNNGTMTAPLRTIRTAMKVAQASITQATPTMRRDQIILSVGRYDEMLPLRDGISIAGGYRRVDQLSAAITEASMSVRYQRDLRALQQAILNSTRAASLNDFANYSVVMGGVSSAGAFGVEPTARNILTATSIQGLVIQAPNAQTLGMSSYGFYCDQCPGLHLEATYVVAGNGADGTKGSDGQPGLVGARGSDGLSASPVLADTRNFRLSALGVGRAKIGAGGAPGLGGDWLRGDASIETVHKAMGYAGGRAYKGGYLSSQDEAPGEPNGNLGGAAGQTSSQPFHGSPGQQGAPGASGIFGNAVVDPYLMARTGSFNGVGFVELVAGEASAGGDGAVGEGGSGGGGAFGYVSTWDAVPKRYYGASGGEGGAGGLPGRGGSPGQSGGNSIGLLFLGDRPQVNMVAVATGRGGNGGVGGLGGMGGAGGAGGRGGQMVMPPRDVPDAQLYHGGSGGVGGVGGVGGDGGGGAGGHSIGIFYGHVQPGASGILLNTDDWTLEPSVRVHVGSAGEGACRRDVTNHAAASGQDLTCSVAGVSRPVY